MNPFQVTQVHDVAQQILDHSSQILVGPYQVGLFRMCHNGTPAATIAAYWALVSRAGCLATAGAASTTVATTVAVVSLVLFLVFFMFAPCVLAATGRYGVGTVGIVARMPLATCVSIHRIGKLQPASVMFYCLSVTNITLSP